MSDEQSTSQQPVSSRDISASNQNGWWCKLKKLFGRNAKNREDLLSKLRSAETDEILDREVLHIIEGAIQVSEMQVREIMIPRSLMVCIRANDNPDSFLPDLISSGHSRFPVIGDNKDDVRGILLAKDLLPLILEDAKKKFNFRDVLRSVVFVPESKRLNILLHDFRTNRNHMAIVLDEYGGVSGLITIEDVMEQIVGDIEDEYDVEEDAFVKQLNDCEYLVQALTPVEYFNEKFNSNFSDEKFDTIGGIVVQEFSYLPVKNEKITLNKFEIKIVQADKRRINMLHILCLK